MGGNTITGEIGEKPIHLFLICRGRWSEMFLQKRQRLRSRRAECPGRLERSGGFFGAEVVPQRLQVAASDVIRIPNKRLFRGKVPDSDAAIMVPSQLPEARALPSGAKATQVIVSSGPSRSC
jgi:hypothetical protein